MPIHIALAVALAESLVLAALLLAWADSVTGARLLVTFLCGVAVWIVGNELPTWLGPEFERPALMLLATAALTSAVFFHFALVFSGAPAPKPVLGLAYGIGLAAMLLSVALPAGSFRPFAGVARMAVPNATGWITSAVWALLAGSGQAVLLRAFFRRRGLERRQIAAVTGSSGWGLLCMSGYGFAALRLPAYPWPLLLLPAYPLILVYGILRYRVLVANAWARRAVAWTLLTGCALLVVAGVPLLPLPGLAGRAASGVLVVLCCLTLAGPARRLAERLVYPGGTVSPEDLSLWRRALDSAESPDGLAQCAGALLSSRLGLAVAAAVGEGVPQKPGLTCYRTEDRWRTDLIGWEAAPPGPLRVAELFGSVLAEAAGRLERAAQLAERERARQTQARLAELGQLAAAVAHDVRNPLNIIGMAAAGADPDIRQEIRTQVDRIAHLSRDLLDYAKPWQIECVPLDLARAARAVAARFPGTEIGSGLEEPLIVAADEGRLEQVLTNLLQNAHAAGARVAIEADACPDAVCFRVLDDGAGIPADLRQRVFEPFASRSPGGTGLGLAIVARIMAAHGGSASVTERAGWTTCLTLSFPRGGG